MAKVRLRLDNEIDILTKSELDDSLDKQHGWEREAAFGLRHQDLPRMYGTPNAGTLNLGGDQPDQPMCGPGQGWYWAVKRVSVDGLSVAAPADAVRLYKETKFVCWITAQPGFVTFGKDGLILKPGDFLRIVGTGLVATGQIEVFGEAVSVPGPLMWKILT